MKTHLSPFFEDLILKFRANSVITTKKGTKVTLGIAREPKLADA